MCTGVDYVRTLGVKRYDLRAKCKTASDVGSDSGVFCTPERDSRHDSTLVCVSGISAHACASVNKFLVKSQNTAVSQWSLVHVLIGARV